MQRPSICVHFFLGLWALLLLLPDLIWGPASTDSFKFSFVWTHQIGVEIAQGTLYPRWLSGAFEGLGSPAFFFYPPLTYWVAGWLHTLGLSEAAALFLTAWLALMLSGVAMHKWLREVGRSPVIGALIYMAAPYHLMDYYVRGALAEFFAFVWLPLIALGIHRLPHRRGLVLLALAYAGLILTHLPILVLGSIFLIAPMALSSISKDRKVLLPLVGAIALGFGLSAFYLLAALTLQGAISSDLLWTDFFRPASWALFKHGTLLTDKAMISLAVGGAVIGVSGRPLWAFISVTAAICSLGLIPWMWEIDPLVRAQFPWRLLGVLEFAAVTAIFTARRISPICGVIGAVFISCSGYQWAMKARERLMMPPNIALLRMKQQDAAEYLPAGFDRKLFAEPVRDVDLSPWRHTPRGQSFKIETTGVVTLGRAAFPTWKVTRDKVDIPYHGPFIRFHATPGVYRIERHVLWQETVGTLTSLLSLIMLCSLALRHRLSATVNPQSAVGSKQHYPS